MSTQTQYFPLKFHFRYGNLQEGQVDLVIDCTNDPIVQECVNIVSHIFINNQSYLNFRLVQNKISDGSHVFVGVQPVDQFNFLVPDGTLVLM